MGGGGGSGSSSGSGSGGGGGSGNKAVVELTASNFDKTMLGDDAFWLVEFFAPWCGHCKQLAPEWAKAAAELAPRGVKLGAVDCTAHESLCGKYEVKGASRPPLVTPHHHAISRVQLCLSGFPTILVFGRDKASPQPYEGPRTADGIVEFAAGRAAKEGPPPQVPQLLSPAVFETACASRQACVLAFLPHILDAGASGRNRSLAILQTGAATFASRPWGFAWSQGGAQPALEKALGGGSFPAVAMLNVKKGVASLMRSALSDANLKEFLNVLPGAGTVTLPDGAVVAVEKWDGKDAPPPEMEVDEFDLSEL